MENNRQIRGINRIKGKYILRKTRKEHQEIEEQSKILDEVNQNEILEEQKEEKVSINEVTQEQEIKKSVDCFKLVVIKKVPWYRKIAQTISQFFRRFQKTKYVIYR